MDNKIFMSRYEPGEGESIFQIVFDKEDKEKMISVRDFIYINKHLCEKNHECTKCSLYGDDVCCIFRAKKTDDIPLVLNAIRIAERQVIQEKIAEANPQILPMRPDPEEAIAKALKEIKNELHDMKRIMDKRRS